MCSSANRPPSRPRKTRIRAKSEGKGLGGRKKKCKRCGKLGHRASHCKESIDPAFGEEEHWGADNATDEPLGTDDVQEATIDEATDVENSIDVVYAIEAEHSVQDGDAPTPVADNTAAATDVAAADPTIEPVPCQDATTVGSAVRYFLLLQSFFATFFECHI